MLYLTLLLYGLTIIFPDYSFSVQIKRTPGTPPHTFSGKGRGGGPPGVLFIWTSFSNSNSHRLFRFHTFLTRLFCSFSRSGKVGNAPFSYSGSAFSTFFGTPLALRSRSGGPNMLENNISLNISVRQSVGDVAYLGTGRKGQSNSPYASFLWPTQHLLC